MRASSRQVYAWQSWTYHPESRPLTGRRIDSEIGVGRNWVEDSAPNRRNVECSSRESCRARFVSMCRGFRKSAMLVPLTPLEVIVYAVREVEVVAC